MPAFFIAEVSSNHNADLARCLNFVRTAAEIGCDAVKFQLFRIEELFAPEILARSSSHRARKNWELPVAFIPPLYEECKKNNIAFCCTPFDLKAVSELRPHVDIFKISSYELTWPALLSACGASGKPVILSTGMATLDECVTATETIRAAGCTNLTLLHCVSNYPTQPKDAHLKTLPVLRQACRCPVGWSDHSVRAGVIQQAIFGFNAAVVEFHLDLDGKGAEYASGHCWLPEQMAAVIQAVRDGEAAVGTGNKTPRPSEEHERLWRADPEDGLRPFKHVRAGFTGDT